MFSQRRRNQKAKIWAVVLVAVILVSFLLLLSYLGSFRTDDQDAADVSPMTEPNVVVNEEQTVSDDTSIEKKEEQEAYYLVKYDKDRICIYFSNQYGQMTKLEDTNILYETLSVEDQNRFEEGVQLQSRDELNRLLMDYES